MQNELGNFMRGSNKAKQEPEEDIKETVISSNSERSLLASYEYMKTIKKIKDSLREGDMVSFTRDGRRLTGRIVTKEINKIMGQTRNVGLSEYTILVEVVANPRTGARYRCSPKYSEVTKV